MEKSMEEQRIRYETEIIRISIIIREQEATILDQTGKIMSLVEILA
jgi:hypothetical protein